MMSIFQLSAPHEPAGDQPKAIQELSQGIQKGIPAQTLLGVTGSGKTFTMAHVIQQVKKSTLVLSHNKTLAAQLYAEFKQYFPHNLVEYFISYYDYYQPEAYIPLSNTYIEKEMSINEHIDLLRLRASSSLLSGREDVIVVASVSCIYGLGNPAHFRANAISMELNQQISMTQVLYRLVDLMYKREEKNPGPGQFSIRGDSLEIVAAYEEHRYIICFGEDKIDRISLCKKGKKQDLNNVLIFPAHLFLGKKSDVHDIIAEIENDLEKQISFLEQEGWKDEADRLGERVGNDLSMIRELGYCSGIENYSRYFDRRKPGERPYCLFDYFPKNFMLIVDESHVTIPQVRAMWGGDRTRKENLVRYGFRLPSALDNRPLTFDEFENMMPPTLFVSATPAEYEIQKSAGLIVEQIIRPTGLLDPKIEVRESKHQVEDLLEELRKQVPRNERSLLTTITKRLAEELAEYLCQHEIRARYLHADIKALDRVDILMELRKGDFDVLVGVNLLREGLDLPEVSLVAILDADKEGFLRNERSLIQTIGRASRNENGRVILYADKSTQSMEKAISKTQRRRKLQKAYNQKHHIIPRTIKKQTEEVFNFDEKQLRKYNGKEGDTDFLNSLSVKAGEKNTSLKPLHKTELQELEKRIEQRMRKAAQEKDYEKAVTLRDDLKKVQQILRNKSQEQPPKPHRRKSNK
ncbi:MAG: excinuclease ABC subunit UvrB [Cytophagales bacterium]|nr:excinuclease ABC subunit UvrB [Cytophagales bacterium]